MKKGYDYYLKITLLLLLPGILITLFIFTKIDDRETAHRMLHMGTGLGGAFIIGLIHLFTRLNFNKEGRWNDLINLILTLALVTLFIWKRTLILSTPMLIHSEYLIFKYGLAGGYLWLFPLMMLHFTKNKINLLLKGITLLGGGYIFSNLLLHSFKISAVGFLITAVFMAIFYTFSLKES